LAKRLHYERASLSSGPDASGSPEEEGEQRTMPIVIMVIAVVALAFDGVIVAWIGELLGGFIN
jgi:hypothetical protein